MLGNADPDPKPPYLLAAGLPCSSLKGEREGDQEGTEQGRGTEPGWLHCRGVSHFPGGSRRRAASPGQVNSPTFRDSLAKKISILLVLPLQAGEESGHSSGQ